MDACRSPSGQSRVATGALPCPGPGPSRSRSAPSLAHVYNLRQYSVERGRIAPESSAAEVGAFHPLNQVDLVGGNGRWRQKRAKEQWALNQAEAEKQRRERQVLEDERRRRREEREARRRKQEEEEQQRQRALEEKMRMERLAQDEKERQEEEERRLKAAQEQSEWLARQPKTCTTCVGSGRCTHCGGKGVFFATFLASSVGVDSMDFGRAPQGCPECGGCAQNILGALVQGSGNCHMCNGVGMVTPKVDGKRRLRTMKTRIGFISSAKKSQTGLDSTDPGHDHSVCSPMAAESSTGSAGLSPLFGA
jgi:hypothetical protein